MSDSTPAAGGAASVRVATFNASLNRNAEGELAADLAAPGNTQARTAAEIVQRVAPDLLLVNEFDHVPGGAAADLFRSNYLERGQDTLGFALFPGQYGMAVFSKHPIPHDQVHPFQTLLWKDMRGARLPDDPA